MALSYCLQHEMAQSIENFSKANDIIDLNPEEKIMISMKSETIRHCIECYLFSSNKIAAIDLKNKENKRDDQKLNAEIIELLFRYYTNDYVGTYLLYDLLKNLVVIFNS
jgi:hypothetical protein